jgi:cbb3-type cytochrome oxidase subunit 3
MPFATSIVVLVITLDYIGFKLYKNRKSNKAENNYALPDGFIGEQR